MEGDPALALCPLIHFRDHPDMEGQCFALHHHWTKGIMPEDGGLSDQANLYNPTMIAVEKGVVAARERLEDIATRKAKKGGTGQQGPKHSRGKRGGKRR